MVVVATITYCEEDDFWIHLGVFDDKEKAKAFILEHFVKRHHYVTYPIIELPSLREEHGKFYVRMQSLRPAGKDYPSRVMNYGDTYVIREFEVNKEFQNDYA